MQRKKTFNAFGALKASLLSVLMSFCVIAAFAQSGTVKGTVTDDTGEPVIGANVVEKGSTNGTITDIDGNYTLQVTNMNGVLQFSFIGYNTTEENIGGRTTINVQLSSGVINLGEVVAIGYGTQTRREITGSVANVDEASHIRFCRYHPGLNDPPAWYLYPDERPGPYDRHRRRSWR